MCRPAPGDGARRDEELLPLLSPGLVACPGVGGELSLVELGTRGAQGAPDFLQHPGQQDQTPFPAPGRWEHPGGMSGSGTAQLCQLTSEQLQCQAAPPEKLWKNFPWFDLKMFELCLKA